jgi:hypothetical protein
VLSILVDFDWIFADPLNRVFILMEGNSLPPAPPPLPLCLSLFPVPPPLPLAGVDVRNDPFPQKVCPPPVPDDIKYLNVPLRRQFEKVGCGLYSLGMIFDYWHLRDRSNVTALVSAKDKLLHMTDPKNYRLFNLLGLLLVCDILYSLEPTTEETMLGVCQKLGPSCFTV